MAARETARFDAIVEEVWQSAEREACLGVEPGRDSECGELESSRDVGEMKERLSRGRLVGSRRMAMSS